jgi:hypothetical protein
MIREAAHRMNKFSIGAAFGVAVFAMVATLPQGAHARDRGVNQPGAVGNPRADPGLNQPGAVGNVGVGAPGVGVGAPGVGARDPGINQPGAMGNRGVAGPGMGAPGVGVADPGLNQPGVAGNVGGVARRSVRL